MVFSSLLFIFAFLPVVWVGFHLLKSEQFAKICDKFCAKFHIFIISQSGQSDEISFSRKAIYLLRL